MSHEAVPPPPGAPPRSTLPRDQRTGPPAPLTMRSAARGWLFFAASVGLVVADFTLWDAYRDARLFASLTLAAVLASGLGVHQTGDEVITDESRPWPLDVMLLGYCMNLAVILLAGMLTVWVIAKQL